MASCNFPIPRGTVSSSYSSTTESPTSALSSHIPIPRISSDLGSIPVKQLNPIKLTPPSLSSVKVSPLVIAMLQKPSVQAYAPGFSSSIPEFSAPFTESPTAAYAHGLTFLYTYPSLRVSDINISPMFSLSYPEFVPYEYEIATVEVPDAVLEKLPDIIVYSIKDALLELESIVNWDVPDYTIRDLFNIVQEMGYPSVLESRKLTTLSYLTKIYVEAQSRFVSDINFEVRLLRDKVKQVIYKLDLLAKEKHKKDVLTIYSLFVERVKTHYDGLVLNYNLQLERIRAFASYLEAVIKRNTVALKVYEAGIQGIKGVSNVNAAKIQLLNTVSELNKVLVGTFKGYVNIASKIAKLNEVNLSIYKTLIDGVLTSVKTDLEIARQKEIDANIKTSEKRLEFASLYDIELSLQVEKLNADLDRSVTELNAKITSLGERADLLQELTSLINKNVGVANDSAQVRLDSRYIDYSSRLESLKAQLLKDIITTTEKTRAEHARLLGEAMASSLRVEGANLASQLQGEEQRANARAQSAAVARAASDAQANMCLALTEVLG